MTDTAQQRWFYEIDGQQQESVNQDKIISMLHDGTLTRDSKVWKQGMVDWVKIADSELAEYLVNIPPPLPTSKASTPPPLVNTSNAQESSVTTSSDDIQNVPNVAIWFLAFAPFIGGFLEGMAAMVANNGNEYGAAKSLSEGYYFLITIGLNIFLGYIDEYGLEKRGIKLKNSWFVPTYMYQRAVRFKHSQAYTVIWCICFGLYLLGALGAY